MLSFLVTVYEKELCAFLSFLCLQFLEILDDHPSAKKLHLANKFEQVAAMIDGAPMY